MKKFSLIVCAIMFSVTFNSCAAKKKVTQSQQPVQQVDPQQAKIDSLKKAQEIRLLELELQAKEAEAQAAIAIAKTKMQNAQYAIEARLEQKLYTPCINEAYDKHGEYMAGLGIAERQMDRGTGISRANERAISDISSRYIGVISNAVSNYSKEVETRRNEQVKEAELESEATAIGKKAIEKYAENVCREVGKDPNGTYTCYVAVHVPIGKVLDEVVNDLEVIKVDADRARFRDYVEKELNKQAEEKEAEQRKLEEYRQQQEQ